MALANASRSDRLKTGFAAAFAVVVALLLAGCGDEGSGGSAQLRVTGDFGQRTYRQPADLKLGPGATAMRQLQSVAKLETSYGGRYVTSIDGIKQDVSNGREWLFYVDGEASEIGAGSWRLKAGEVVQWDLHRWAAVSTDAIVGAFPRPMRSRGVTYSCADDASAACEQVRDRLGAERYGPRAVEVVVGPWARISRTVPELASDASHNDAFAAFSGDRMDAVDQTGRVSRSFGPGAGLIALLGEGKDLRLVVTGTDEAGVELAARSMNGANLAGRFAVAFAPGGDVVPLPLLDVEPGG